MKEGRLPAVMVLGLSVLFYTARENPFGCIS